MTFNLHQIQQELRDIVISVMPNITEITHPTVNQYGSSAAQKGTLINQINNLRDKRTANAFVEKLRYWPPRQAGRASSFNWDIKRQYTYVEYDVPKNCKRKLLIYTIKYDFFFFFKKNFWVYIYKKILYKNWLISKHNFSWILKPFATISVIILTAIVTHYIDKILK